MRVRIIFHLKNKGAAVPFHHQHLISTFLDEAMLEAGYSPGQEVFYSFSGIKGQTKVGKGGLFFFSSRVTIVLSSHNKELIDNILKVVFSRHTIVFGEMELEPESAELEKDPEFKEEMKYVSISPIITLGYQYGDSEAVVKQFIDPFSDVFSDYLYESTMARMEASGWFTEEDFQSFFKFQVVPDTHYIDKIKRNGKKFSRVYDMIFQGERKEVRGYTIPFTLYADPKVQQFVFECGFGEYANLGYGLLDIANSNPLERAEVYQLPK